jgi:hypothetical protein
MEQKEFELVSIIAGRKAEFYMNARDNLLASLPPNVDRDEARTRLRKAVAELENSLFISDEEKASNTVKAGLLVSQLKLNSDAILSRLTEALIKT